MFDVLLGLLRLPQLRFGLPDHVFNATWDWGGFGFHLGCNGLQGHGLGRICLGGLGLGSYGPGRGTG